MSEPQQAQDIEVSITFIQEQNCTEVKISHLPDFATREDLYAVLHSLDICVTKDANQISASKPKQNHPRETLMDEEMAKIQKFFQELTGEGDEG